MPRKKAKSKFSTIPLGMITRDTDKYCNGYTVPIYARKRNGIVNLAFSGPVRMIDLDINRAKQLKKALDTFIDDHDIIDNRLEEWKDATNDKVKYKKTGLGIEQ